MINNTRILNHISGLASTDFAWVMGMMIGQTGVIIAVLKFLI